MAWAWFAGADPVISGKFMVRNFKAWINAVAWSPDGKLIATGEKETSVKLFNATDGRFVSELTTVQ